MNDDVLKGWKLAREHYQNHGSVPPYPPKHVFPGVPVEAQPVGIGEAIAPKADWEGGMNPPEQAKTRRSRRKTGG